MRYFVALAEELHFGRTAGQLRITRPALEQEIENLEEFLGVSLFARDNGHVALTHAGDALLDNAWSVIELSDRAVENVRSATHDRTAQLHIASRALGPHPVADELIRQFCFRFPEVEVEIHPGLAPQSLDQLTHRTIDIVVVLGPFDAPDGVRYLPLGFVEPIIVLPSDHRLASLERVPRSELAKEVFFDWPRRFNPPLVDHRRGLLFGPARPEHLVEIADFTVASRLLRVAAGLGVTATEHSALADLQIPALAFRRLENPPPELEYGIVWLETSASHFVPPFVDLARDLAGSFHPSQLGLAVPAPPVKSDGLRPGRYDHLERYVRQIAAELHVAGEGHRDPRSARESRLPAMDELAPRQRQIVDALLAGDRVPAIAETMFLSASTVRNHLTRVFEIFDVHSQAELLTLLRSEEGTTPH